MDPFARLPPEILHEMFCFIEDLPTLYALHGSSPAVFTFLHNNTNRVSTIVEAILDKHYDVGGRCRASIDLLRLVALIWWRVESNDEDNHLPRSIDALQQAFTRKWSTLRAPDHNFEPLPNSIPRHIICRLLAFSTRVRQIAHVLFHDAVSRCLSLRPEHMEATVHPSDYTFNNTTQEPTARPPGHRVIPCDVGPPSWVEEQRLTEGLLRVMVFYQLRTAILRHGIMGDSDVLLDLPTMQPGEFWNKEILSNPNAMDTESFRTAWAMLEQQAGGAEVCEQWIHSAMPESQIYCCPHLRRWEVGDLRDESGKLLSNYDQPAINIMVMMQLMPRSPVRCVHRKFYRPFGLMIWDLTRLEALGFGWRTRRQTSSPSDPLTWYTWSSILTEEQWADTHQMQRERPDNQRIYRERT